MFRYCSFTKENIRWRLHLKRPTTRTNWPLGAFDLVVGCCCSLPSLAHQDCCTLYVSLFFILSKLGIKFCFWLAVAQNQLLWSIVPDRRHPVSGNLLLSMSIALLITSIAWIFQRPWLGVSMIVAAVSPFIYFARGISQYQRVPFE